MVAFGVAALLTATCTVPAPKTAPPVTRGTLPATVAAGLWLWRRRPWGFLLSGTMLVLFVIESVSIEADAWLMAQPWPVNLTSDEYAKWRAEHAP
jgi:hypothetical protein